jgi:hypothetical protein
MSKPNSRWRKGAERYSSKTTVERTTLGKDRRRETNSLTEAKACEQARESLGWFKGARVVRKQVKTETTIGET